MKRHIGLAVVVSVLWLVGSIAAQTAGGGSAATSVPPLVQFSGVVNGQRTAGMVGITFSLYAEQEGGAPLWLETQNVQPDKNGNYAVMLGSTTTQGLPSSLFVSGQARWLGVQPQGQEEQPRVMLLSVPYALKAGDAQTLGGKPASAFLPGSGGNAIGSNGIINNAISGGGTTDYVPLWLSKSKLGSSKIFQSTGGDLGIGTTSPAANLDVNGTSDIRNTLTLFPNGSSPTLSINGTAFQVSSTGTVTFVSGQTFPGTGTITGVTAGSGLTGGGTSGNVTLSVPNAGITNAMLQNSSLTVTAGTALTGGGAVSLGGSTTLNVDTTKVPLLKANNTFTGNQTVNGNLSATGVVSGSAYQIGSNLFGYGSYANGNAFLGFAGNSTMTGGYNTASGYQALYSNTTGADNTADGYHALYYNNTGNYNTASGMYALAFNQGGEDNTANGFAALQSNSTGSYSTASGFQALYSNTTGGDNTASGYDALLSNSTGSDNTASGTAALRSNTTGSGNTASGYNALYFNTTGSGDTAIGYSAGPDQNSTSLTNSTTIGAYAVVSQSNALVLGCTSGINNCPAPVNVGIGTTTPQYALDVHGTGNFTGLITFASGQTFPGTGTVTQVNSGAGLTGGPITGSGTLSVATGGVTNAMLQNSSLTVTAGTALTGGGAVSLGGSTTLNVDTTKVPLLNANNTFTGNQTVNGNLSATGVVTGSGYQIGSNLFDYGSYANNSAFLGFAGNSANAPGSDTGVGYQALYSDTANGGVNVAIGVRALLSNTTGYENTASGPYALASNTTGDANTASGNAALYSNSTGSANTAIGFGAGTPLDSSYVTGSNNTFLGAFADLSTGSLSNATAIGANTEVAASNALVLGCTTAMTPYCLGNVNVGIGTTAPPALLTVDGSDSTSSGLGAAIQLANSASGGGTWYIRAGATGNGTPAGGLSIANYGGYWLNITSGGKVGFNVTAPTHNIDMSDGAYENSGTWTNASDRSLKEGFEPVDEANLLAKLNAIPMQTWRYKSESAAVRHLGPMAQDFHAAFSLGQDDKHISTVDEGGVALAAIQELYREGLKKDGEIRAQQAQIKAQAAQIEAQQAELKAQQARGKLQEAQIAQLMSQVKAIQASLKTNGRTGAEVRTVKAQAPMVHQ